MEEIKHREFVNRPSNWVPTTNPRELKVLGKFLEELGENVQATARCLIQGFNESEPSTGVPNREWMIKELGDLYGNFLLVVEHYRLPMCEIETRAAKKMEFLREWHKFGE